MPSETSTTKASRSSSNCESRCSGRDDSTDNCRSFSGEYDFRVHFYIREDDHRARILCKSPRSARTSEYYCLPLNMLEIVRVGSCLQLCRRGRGGAELIIWASFKFTTIERTSNPPARDLS